MADDPRTAVGPDILDRIARLEAAIRDVQVSLIGSSLLGTDQTIKASHDRLDSLLGAGNAAPNGSLVNNLNADLLDGKHASEMSGTEQIWLDPHCCDRTQGTGSSGTSGPGSSKSYYVTFPDGQDTAYSWTFPVPASWSGAEVHVTWYGEAGSAGNIYMQVCSNHVHAGKKVNGVSESTAGEVWATPWTGLGIKTQTAHVTLGTTGTMQRIALRRLSSNAGDTMAAAVNLYGVLITKV